MTEVPADAPHPYVRYIDKTKAYYLSQGYEKPYVWAKNDSAPFTSLRKPLAQSTITLISTSEIAIKDDPRFDSLTFTARTHSSNGRHLISARARTCS